MLYVIGELLREDHKGQEIFENPETYVKGTDLRSFKNAIERLFQLLVYDIGNFIEDWRREHDDFFDYKNFFKNSDRARQMSQNVTPAYKKTISSSS